MIQRFMALSLISMLISSFTIAQQPLWKRKSAFLELGGSGGLGSLNYEQFFFTRPSLGLAFRAGLSFAPIDRNNGTGIVLPVMVHGIAGKGAHFAEAGLGQGFTVTTKGQFYFLGTAAFGYRLQPPTSRFFLRATYTPLISWLLDFQWQHWAGISIGYTFNSKPE